MAGGIIRRPDRALVPGTRDPRWCLRTWRECYVSSHNAICVSASNRIRPDHHRIRQAPSQEVSVNLGWPVELDRLDVPASHESGVDIYMSVCVC